MTADQATAGAGPGGHSRPGALVSHGEKRAEGESAGVGVGAAEGGSGGKCTFPGECADGDEAVQEGRYFRFIILRFGSIARSLGDIRPAPPPASEAGICAA